MKAVGPDVVKKFQNSNFWRFQFSAFVGFFFGLKACDYFLFDDKKFEVIREEMEEEFWAKHGEPKEIQPYMIPSSKAGKEGELRKSWIYIMYEKDKLVKKTDYFD